MENINLKEIDKIAIIDFETANNNRDSACSVGITVLKENMIYETAYFLIKPPYNFYNINNVRIHHLTQKDTEKAETFDLVWEKIKKYFDGTYFIGSHSNFDINVLYSCLRTYNLELPNFYYFDTIKTSGITLTNGEKIRGLDKLCSYYNIDFINHHNALADSIATAKVFKIFLTENRAENLYLKLKKYLTFFNHLQIEAYEIPNIDNQMIYAVSEDLDVLKEKASENLEINKLYENKFFVFTGSLADFKNRDNAYLEVFKIGGNISRNINKSTNILVIADEFSKRNYQSGKIKKALSLNETYEKENKEKIIFLSEDEFYKIINHKRINK